MALHEDYQVSMVADWFHAVPHVDIGFSPVNSTFDPTSNVYLESLGILIAVPGFWLILTLLAFLIFFLCRCCDSGLKKKRRLTPLKWTLALFALLCCGALALGLFGNDQAHSGVVAVQKSTQYMEDNLSNFGNQTQYLERALGQNAKDQLQGLTEALAGPMPDAAARNVLDRSLELIKGNLSVGAGRAQELHSRIGHLTLSPLPRALELIELFRWPATIGLLCVLILVCLLLLWGVIRHSRCLLILVCTRLKLFVLLVLVLSNRSIEDCLKAGSDFCLDPEPFLQKQSSGMVDNAVLNYYLHCRHDSSSPFVEPLREARAAVDGVQTLMAPVTQIADRYFPRKEVHSLLGQLGQELNGSQNALGKLGLLLDCRPLNREYHRAMDATCTGLLEGTAFMLASALGGGLLFTVLIWVASHTWIHIRQSAHCPPLRGGRLMRRRPRDTVDEEDPFLPPSAASMRPVASDSWEPLLASKGGVARRGGTPERALSFSFVSFA
ncbi:hypothetical protein HPB52_009218 [Rhipicephalus sanguineus]|uniref:Protein tweety homolog n=1 Tax=Rhipicephalus sanguineus TaxID=34632 RepID=A0A9D4PJR1_RHISA|nr:hypothetical protein HPB52_009218 [Rhipicephalus sanguineus]